MSNARDKKEPGVQIHKTYLGEKKTKISLATVIYVDTVDL